LFFGHDFPLEWLVFNLNNNVSKIAEENTSYLMINRRFNNEL